MQFIAMNCAHVCRFGADIWRQYFRAEKRCYMMNEVLPDIFMGYQGLSMRRHHWVGLRTVPDGMRGLIP